MVTHYLCDLENIYDRWSNLAQTAQAGDKFTLFYTKSIKSIHLEAFGPASVRGVEFAFAECECGRHNALDFQLVCELGRLSAQYPDRKYVILSGDTGFQSVVKFMADRGIQVSCINPNPINPNTIKPQEDETPEPESDPEPEIPTEPSISDIYFDMLRKTGLDDSICTVLTGILRDTMASPQNQRKLNCRNRIRSVYGAQEGEAIYIKIKGLVQELAVNGPRPEKVKTKKNRAILSDDNIRIALESIDWPIEKKTIANITKAITNARKCKNPRQSIADRIKKLFGKKKTDDLIDVLIPFVSKQR